MSVGLICEFNPFHYGHKYIIDKAHELNEPVICVMSGPFVQRGEPACASKYDRAKAALSMGADAVVELPTRFCLSAAKNFAKGGVEVLKNIKGVNALIFGIECESELLFEIAELKRQPKTDKLIKVELESGSSYPTAVKNAITKSDNKLGEALVPNNILALEYLEALKGTDIKPIPIRRIGKGYNSLELSGDYASATAIRYALLEGKDCSRFLPHIMRDKVRFYDKNLLEKLIKFALLSRSIEQLQKLPEVETGFEYLLFEAARLPTLADTIDRLKSKRYTYSRIRRILLSALLNLDSELDSCNIKTRVLGIKKEFTHNLSDFKDNLITRNSLASKEFCNDKNVIADCFAQDVYALITGGNLNEYYSTPMIIV